jgi:DNA-binding XRE family transcriptional regulator
VTSPASARRDLGRRLADARKAAGYTQKQLATVAGYSRSTVSNAEIGHPDVAREFWARCDQALKTSRAFTLVFDQIKAAERRQAVGRPETVTDTTRAFRRARQRLTSTVTAEALAGYRDLGWAVRSDDECLELVTGDNLDALELPRAAGMLAVSLWLYSQGRPDEVRRLPGLPRPSQALAVITAGDRCYFLAAAGGCPWSGQESADWDGAAGPAIRWHAGGARVPAPPSRLPSGERVSWAHLPSSPAGLAPSIALLGLLATAAAAAGQGPPALTLPGGIRVVPAPRPA